MIPIINQKYVGLYQNINMVSLILLLYAYSKVVSGITVSKIPSTGTPPHPFGYSSVAYDETLNRLITFGGYIAETNEYISNLHSFNLTDLSWDIIYPESDYEPPGISNAYSTIHSNALYVFFGRKFEGMSSDIYKFDLTLYAWQIVYIQGDVISGRYSYSFEKFLYLNSTYVAVYGGITRFGYDNELYL